MSTEPKRTVDRYMEEAFRFAQEAGRYFDRTMQKVESDSKEFMGSVSKEAKEGTREMRRRTSIMVDEVKQEVPRVRAELREMEARIKERMKRGNGPE
ncbi:MAG: hypothetical protein ISF22_11505 [Methanomassiliicoccus sp.]|nr:hypothetical protein [Methanomassiliicoccus sp.]